MTETEKMRKVFHRDFLGAHRYTTRGGTVRLAGGVLGTAVVFHGQPREEATLSLRCARHNYPNSAMPLIDFFGGMFYDRMEQEEAKIMSVLKFKCRCCNSYHDTKLLSEKWWEYWKDYWQKRGTKDAYKEDYACEVTIPYK